MIIEPRLKIVMIILSAGGLLWTATRHKANSLSQQPIALDILDQADIDEGDITNRPEYNYCQALRPTPKTYPAPKVKGAVIVNSQLFIRHGDRTPVAVLPHDLDLTWECANMSAYSFTAVSADQAEKSPFQYANVVAHQVVTIPSESPFASTHMWKGSCIPGQLTPVGAMQHRKLGAALRRIYVDELKLLPATFDPETVHIRSTDVWRTKQSAEHLMTGLYGVRSHSQNAASPPVLQIHTLPVEIDYLTMNGGACPHLSQLRSHVEKSSEVLKRLREDNVEFNKELVSILGVEKTWSGYMDTVLPRICHGYPLQCQDDGQGSSKCITRVTAEKILKNVGIQTAEVYHDGNGVFDVLKLGIGPLTSEIKRNLLAAKANGKVRFSFYSGHDTTISPLLGMLDSTDQRWPPYASNLLIELWKTPRGAYYVRVLYNRAILETQSNWCDLGWCPLESFVEYLDQFIIEDVRTACQRQ